MKRLNGFDFWVQVVVHLAQSTGSAEHPQQTVTRDTAFDVLLLPQFVPHEENCQTERKNSKTA